MALFVNDKYIKSFIKDDEFIGIRPAAENAVKLINDRSGLGNEFLGWVDLPVNYDKYEFCRINSAAEKIKKSCDIFIVIGIGGSYLGARAAIEFVKSPLYNSLKKDTPDIYFTGNNISSTAMSELLEICKGKEICVNVISKSGKTTEPAVAFRIFRELLESKYKGSSKEHIFVTTDKSDGALKTLADEKGYETFVVPNDIGGRYSVLTAVGLLPIAVAGCDIESMMNGAALARMNAIEDCKKYASIRNILYNKGKTIEIMVGYDNALSMLNEWWKQLYGESEGKDGKALFPASVINSTDLHSMGQLIQDGRRNLFETVINIKSSRAVINIPSDPDDLDKLNYIAAQGLNLHNVNQKAFMATVLAHVDGGVPNVILEVDGRTENDFGYIVYFFEMACAISGYMLGINPFDQPGVENYKDNMFALLNKTGEKFDKIREQFKIN